MTQLVNDVLTFCEAEAGTLPFNPTPLHVEEFCHNLVQKQRQLAGDRHTLNYIPENTCGTANLDEQLLRYILANLLTNAVKSSPAGSTVFL